MTVYWYDRLGFNGHMGLKVVLVITGVVYVIYKNNKTNNNFKANLSDFQSSVVCKLSTTFTVIFLTPCVCIYHLECVTFIPVRSHWCQRHAQYIQRAILDCLLVQESNSSLSVLVFFKVTFFDFFCFFYLISLDMFSTWSTFLWSGALQIQMAEMSFWESLK